MDSVETKEVDLTAVAKAPAEAVHKEFSAQKIHTNDGSGETKEVDLTAVAKASPETEAVLNHNFAEETDKDEESGETKEIDVTGEAQVTSETVLKEDCAGKQTRMWKRRRLFYGCSRGINRSSF